MSEQSEYRDPWEIVTPLTDEERAAKLDRMRERLANAESVERDAARYRWLVRHMTDTFARNNMNEPRLSLPVGADYFAPGAADAAIDAAMQAGEGSK